MGHLHRNGNTSQTVMMLALRRSEKGLKNVPPQGPLSSLGAHLNPKGKQCKIITPRLTLHNVQP